MPQFDLSTFIPQLVWLTVFFAILYFGIVQLTLPRLGRVMKAREDKVSEDISGAGTAKEEADRVAEARDAAISRAQAEARTSVAAAKADVARAIEARLGESSQALQARQQEAEANLAAARSKAMGEIERLSAEAAAAIVERLTGRSVAPAHAAKAAGAALAKG